jgi:hypothetical protein
MPRPPQRAAAYTRTGILQKFLDQLANMDPGRVDNAYAETSLGLKGGDVRAFLQSLRVLGLIELHGETTPRARRMRAASARAGEMRQALAEAYPELWEHWHRTGGMHRDAVEDFFKVHYGLSTSSAGPASKLFIDLMRAYGADSAPAPVRGERPRSTAAGSESSTSTRPTPAWPPATGAPPQPTPAASALPTPWAASAAAPSDVRLAALDAVKSSLHIDINADWDPARIELVFDRMERLVDRILTKT